MADKKKLIVDPPSGWRYGFPRAYDEEKDGPFEEFLIHHGYPESEVDFASRHTRMWEEE
jgi:hypothetical protein